MKIHNSRRLTSVGTLAEDNFTYLWNRLKEMSMGWKEDDDVYTRYGQASALDRLTKDLKGLGIDGRLFQRRGYR